VPPGGPDRLATQASTCWRRAASGSVPAPSTASWKAPGPVAASPRYFPVPRAARAAFSLATQPSLFTCLARPSASAPGGTGSVMVEPAAT